MCLRIKKLRLEKNLTSEDVSKKLGIPENLYINYENLKENIPTKRLIKLAFLFDTSTDYLLSQTNSRIPHNRSKKFL